MSPTEAAYVAGFVDGEGTITIGRTRRDENRVGFRYLPCMSVSNSHRVALDRIRDMCGNGRVIGNYHKLQTNHRTVYVLRWGANQIRHLLPQLRPFLIVKAQQADLLMEFQRVVVNGRNITPEQWQQMEILRHDIRALNRRGQPADTPADPVSLRPRRAGYRQRGYTEFVS